MLFIVNMPDRENSKARPKIGISSCLLGQQVRYDGGHKRDQFLTQQFGKFVEWVPVCPEVEVGMGVPREAVRLVGALANPKMIGVKSEKDWSAEFIRFAARRSRELAAENLSGYIFKKDSPSCGLERVRVYGMSRGVIRQGRGLFASAVTKKLRLLPVEEEGRLNDPILRENFIERVFAYRRWQDLLSAPKTVTTLMRFHTVHKYLLLAHSERHYHQLGRIVAAATAKQIRQRYDTYGDGFMAALAVHATAKTHSNVLDHMIGYFSNLLSPAEKQELLSVIADFRRRLIPLIVPMTLIRHYANKYRSAYLQCQLYLEPSPKELMLRNHV
jgi:uncharacterized protein YbgA (DUF1722 family)/uncharacterized protein YbbK (DUF523 family)